MIDTLPLLPDERAGTFDSRYRVVRVAAQRAKQIMRGMKRSHASKFTKETSLALEEVLRGNVDYLIGEEARQALREAKQNQEHPGHPSGSAEADEDAKEIKRQLGVYIDDSPKEAAPASDTEG